MPVDTVLPFSVTIYRKTPKGHAEVETRAHALPQRLRSLLIMIDGRQPDSELRKIADSSFDAQLQSLLAGGFVEPLNGPRESPAPPRTQPARSAGLAPLSPVGPAVDVPLAQAPPALSTEPPPAPAASNPRALRRAAVRSLIDQLGPTAEPLAREMKRARRWEELRPLLLSAQQLIGSTRGSGAAQTFRDRFIGP